MRTNERDDVSAQLCRIAQAFEHAVGDERSLLGVLEHVDERLAEVVQQSGEAHGQRARRGSHDLEDVLVDRAALARVVRVVADHRPELGDDREQHAGVAREPQRLRGLRAEQQLRQLPHAVRLQAAADPFGRDEPDVRCLFLHLAQRLVVGCEVELRDEAKPANACAADPRRASAA